jgi:hypothetical protein
MKRALTLILFVAFFVTAAIAPVIGQEEMAAESAIVYGFRMETDMLFYIEAGVLMGQADFMAGIGWNNNILAGEPVNVKFAVSFLFEL